MTPPGLVEAVRASDWQVPPDIALRTCSAEDLVLYKLVAGRLIDLHDVQSVVGRMGANLDADRVRLGRTLC